MNIFKDAKKFADERGGDKFYYDLYLEIALKIEREYQASKDSLIKNILDRLPYNYKRSILNVINDHFEKLKK